MNDFSNFYSWYLRYFQSKDENTATLYDKYMALSYAVRTHIADSWIDTQKKYRESNDRRIYYLSFDYNFGKSLSSYIVDTGIEEEIGSMAASLNATMDEIIACEPEFDLGNQPKGGASLCVQEILASQGVPAMGYGLWYEYGRFRQKIIDGMQHEQPYNWKAENHPWNVNRPEYEYNIAFGGSVVPLPVVDDDEDNINFGVWNPDEVVKATPWDYPVVGYRNGVVNTVRFWDAVTSGDFHPDYLNHGEYIRACDDKSNSVNMTRYLFPDDEVKQTTEVRIKQQYFLVSSSLKDIVRRYKSTGGDIRNIGDKIVIHLTDSKCAIAVIEMIRILSTEEIIPFVESLDIVRNLFIFSTSALSYDDLETWPLYLVESILPQHSDIIFKVNHFILNDLKEKINVTDEELRAVSLIEEGAVKKFRLANIAAIFSHYVTGTSEYQLTILKDSIFKHFTEYFDTEFVGGTTGISVRRWLNVPNPELAALVNRTIGSNWIADSRELIKLINYIDDENVQTQFLAIKATSKQNVFINLQGMFGVEIPRDNMVIGHFRKIKSAHRQILQVIYIVHRYLQLKKGEELQGRTYIIGGVASPSDFLGKQIIHLANMVSSLINSDTETNKRLQLFFIPNCTTSVEESLLPGLDLVEYPSAKGSVAFSVDLLKYVINGAVPLIGASSAEQEIAELLGHSHIFSFKEDENDYIGYEPSILVDNNKSLTAVFEYIEKHIPEFKNGDAIYPLLSSLRYNDEFKTILVFESYREAQMKIDVMYRDKSRWSQWALHNLARSGLGSLDGIIDNFYNKVWM